MSLDSGRKIDGCFPKIRGKPRKWKVKIVENLIKHGMIWGETPLFLETPILPP